METTTKMCTTCNTIKTISLFTKSKQTKAGISSRCKSCSYEAIKTYNRTKLGLINKIYKSQKANSKSKNRPVPNYTVNLLINWLTNDWLFNLLYENWVNCGYPKDLSPSIDRINHKNPYTADNIQIMTWGDNKLKSIYMYEDRGGSKKVGKFDLDGNLIKVYRSATEAQIENGIKSRSQIPRACHEKHRVCKGHRYRFL